ncbi:MAG: hypothetical protein ABIT37_18545 [Luteolibacter sp.]
MHRVRAGRQVTIHLNADLKFNINLLLNHNRQAIANDEVTAIFERGGVREIGYDGKQNLAPFDLRPGEHDAARRRYLDQVMTILMNEIHRAANLASNYTESIDTSINVSGRPTRFSLREVETCWDFPIDQIDAADVVEDLAPIFREWGGKSGWVGDGETLTTKFSNAQNLVMYAKNRTRVRMEVRVRPPKGDRPHCFDRLSDAIAELDTLREQAVQRVNDCLLGFHARRFPREGPE